MADAATAIEFVLKQEDADLSGKVTTDAGGRTRYGIAERFHPALTDTQFYGDMPAEEALEDAKEIYQTEYWKPISGDHITSQDVANRVLSFAVNLGPEQAIILLQKAINSLGLSVPEDGAIGKQTLSAVNSASPQALLANWREILTAFYQGIVERNPKQAPYLHGWLNRVNQ